MYTRQHFIEFNHISCFRHTFSKQLIKHCLCSRAGNKIWLNASSTPVQVLFRTDFFYLFKKQPESCTEQASQGNMYNLANLASPTNCRFDRYIFVPRWQRRRSNHARSKKVQYISQRKRCFRRTSSQEIIRQSKMANNKTVEAIRVTLANLTSRRDSIQ